MMIKFIRMLIKLTKEITASKRKIGLNNPRSGYKYYLDFKSSWFM
jgi:hypothetical protein